MAGQLVNRVPPGLLSLLGIKSLGQAPALLSDTIAPTIELLGAYLQANGGFQRLQTGPIAGHGLFPATATPGTGVVPPGRLWACSNITVTSDVPMPAATTFIDVQACYFTSPVADLSQTFGVQMTPASATAVNERVMASVDGVILIPPNATMSVHVRGGVVGTSVNFNVLMRYIELLI